MNPILKQLIIQTTLVRKPNESTYGNSYSEYALAKGYRELLITIKRQLKDYLWISIGILSAAFGLNGFLFINGFIDGGATGISLLISEITDIPLFLLIIAVNIPFIFLAYKVIGTQFAFKTTIAIGGLAIALLTIDFPHITNDKLLVSVFGGFFLGAGIGFSVRGSAVIDGTEVLAIFLSRKLGTTIGDIIVGINIIVFGTAAYLLGIEVALYSMITYLSASKTLDFIVEGVEEYLGVTLISSHSIEISQMITDVMERGVTVYNGKRGFGKRGERKDFDIVYTIITRLELSKLNTEIKKIDPNAFVAINSVKDTKGGMIKKRPLKH